MYSGDPRVELGIEFNPKAEQVSPLANVRVLNETASRPAVMVGTSSDRIGTPSGRAYFATLSKDLERATGLPVAPYLGAAYGEFEDETKAIGGLHVRWSDRWTSTHLWDGYNLHHLLDRQMDGGLRLGLVLVEQDGKYYGGFSLGLALGD